MPSTPSVLTIISASGANILTAPLISKLKNQISTTTNSAWLSPDEAIDIFLDINWQEKTPAKDVKDQITELLSEYPVDFALQPQANRRKKLLISDMDSTIIQEECIDEIAYMAGIKPKIADITERAMRGDINFDDALKERVGLLKGLETTALETVIQERLHLSKGATTLVQTMAKHGAFCALVSGGFTYFTEKIAKLTGFHTTQANTLEIKDNQLTGNIILPILGGAAKKTALKTFTKQQNILRSETLAVGDGANDLEMITHAGLGIAYQAKPIVAEKSDAAVNHTDLTSLLYMQGYQKTDFVKESPAP